MPERTSSNSLSVALIGSGGAGVMTAGQTILDAAAASGFFGLMTRSTGPQIRGGEAAAIVRVAAEPVECQDDRVDLLIALDWHKAERFATELVLDGDTLIIADPDQGQAPEWITGSDARRIEVPFTALAREHKGARVNTIAVGLVASMIGLRDHDVERTVERILTRKGSRLIEGALAGLRAGAAAAGDLPRTPTVGEKPETARKRWLITGNEAVGMGAIRGGVRFCAAYPITPSTEIQEWLADNLPRVGGSLIQAEDELASINMCLGASFGGTPAMTATSGPGFSLMAETLGLAVAAEIPVVVVDVMRSGPSTGIPTKSEQADLNMAVYGAHGDAPRVVVAPNSIGDCLSATQWAVHLAEALQSPAVVLSDQLMAQARAAIEPPQPRDWRAERRQPDSPGPDYERFADTEEGVSPMAVPGTAGGEYTATGLTHMRDGRPSAIVDDHRRQLDKRQRKLERFDYGDYWADIEGNGDIAVVTWGSSTLAAREASERMRARGLGIRLISVRLLSPLDEQRMAEALAGCSRVLIVEQSHRAQFYRYLRAWCDLPEHTRVFNQPGPLSLAPGTIADEIHALALEDEAA